MAGSIEVYPKAAAEESDHGVEVVSPLAGAHGAYHRRRRRLLPAHVALIDYPLAKIRSTLY
jgi:hypothetical protein